MVSLFSLGYFIVPFQNPQIYKERYKTDINLAIQLLQCKPDSFVPQKVSSLPVEIQSKVSTYMRLETNSHSDSEGSTSGVGLATPGSYKVLPVSDSPPPICPFPPTAMVYSMRGLDATRANSDCNGKGDQMISPSAMAKYLQDELKASEIKHCDTCNCSPKDLTVLIDEPKTYNVGTQTIVQSESGNSLCLRCNSNLNSPSRTNSPYIMKIVKSSDSVISETKSSVSDLLDNEKLFTPAKKDDLMVNPILGHHRLCDRTVSKQHQQQICDTAKYIVETKKLENEIADLRKFNDKSPNLSLGSELCSTFSKSIVLPVDIKSVDLNADIRQNGSATLIADNGNDNETVEINAENSNLQHQQVQGTCTSVKSDTSDIAGDKKPENNLQQENNSQQGSNDKNMNKVGNTITGSTNSLWSKSSSSEGAKIFENFNRNLIKTIKAENPSHRGPRLCALRIQNGSNNILLDNIDSEITPIVYTRPARFLDEELDDSKDIITSKISMLMSKRNSLSTTSSQVNSIAGAKALPSTSQQQILDTTLGAASVDPDNEASTSVCPGNGDINIRQANLDSNNYCDVIQSVLNANSIECSSNSQQNKQSSMPHPIEQQSDSIVFDATLDNHTINRISNIELENSREHLLAAFRNSPLRHSSNCPDQQQNWNGIVVDFQRNPESKQHYEVLMLEGDNSLNSSIKNTTSKSATQSSSISSSGVDIDVQESALLRRQQLTRVAEWVQNNTQQQNLELKPAPSTHYCNSTHLLASNQNCTTISQTSLSCNSNTSIEKFSISDSTSCRAARPILLNGTQNTLNNNCYQVHSNSSQPQLQLTKPRDINSLINNCQNVQESIAQNSYPSLYHDSGLKVKNTSVDSSDKPILMQPRSLEAMREMQSSSQENQNVDLAQMEYNVKQFLLKQSEWSICNVNRSLNSTSPTNTIRSPDKPSAALPATSGNNNLKSSYERQTIAKNHSLPLRTETNL